LPLRDRDLAREIDDFALQPLARPLVGPSIGPHDDGWRRSDDQHDLVFQRTQRIVLRCRNCSIGILRGDIDLRFLEASGSGQSEQERVSGRQHRRGKSRDNGRGIRIQQVKARQNTEANKTIRLRGSRFPLQPPAKDKRFDGRCRSLHVRH